MSTKKGARVILHLSEEMNTIVESYQEAHKKRIGERISKGNTILKAMSRVGEIFLTQRTEEMLEEHESYNQIEE